MTPGNRLPDTRGMDKMTPDSLRDEIHGIAGRANAPYTPPHLMTEGKGVTVSELKSAIEAAPSFMGVGSKLKEAGIRYEFVTDPFPVYIVNVKGSAYVIINKKYAEDPEFTVGNIAVGPLGESIKTPPELAEESRYSPKKSNWNDLANAATKMPKKASDFVRAVNSKKDSEVYAALKNLCVSLQLSIDAMGKTPSIAHRLDQIANDLDIAASMAKRQKR